MKLKTLLPLAVGTLLGAGLASADISYTCDPSVAAATCNYLNTTVAGQYNNTFSNANADIYIQYGTTGLGESTSGYLNLVSYSSYGAALAAEGGPGAVRADALASLAASEPGVYSGGQIEVTSALRDALGLSGMIGTTAGGSACFTPGSGGCYNGIITITNDPGTPLYYDNLGGPEASDAYDYYAVVEHETDEVLGTASCIDTTSGSLEDGCGGTNASAVDLFRYSAPGTLVFSSTTPGAYFSYDGGATNGAVGTGGGPKFYSTLANGDDYADFVSSSPDCGTNQSVQDAEGCPGEDAGLNILNDGGAEINILDAVGFNLNSPIAVVPEPSSILLLLSALGVAAFAMRRRVRNR